MKVVLSVCALLWLRQGGAIYVAAGSLRRRRVAGRLWGAVTRPSQRCPKPRLGPRGWDPRRQRSSSGRSPTHASATRSLCAPSKKSSNLNDLFLKHHCRRPRQVGAQESAQYYHTQDTGRGGTPRVQRTTRSVAKRHVRYMPDAVPRQECKGTAWPTSRLAARTASVSQA